MEAANQNHLQPLLPTTVDRPPSGNSSAFGHHRSNYTNLYLSNSEIYFRVVLILVIGVISVWANYEASKGFDIKIISENHESDNWPAGKRFDLFYVSNDRISRLVISTSRFVEGILYPNDESYAKKEVNRVIVQLAVGANLTGPVTVDSRKGHEFVLTISPSVMEEIDFRDAMFLAVLQGMARVWLWDGQGKAPPSLINGMVKYLTFLALSNRISNSDGKDRDRVLPVWDDKEADAVAQSLKHCEDHKQGFLRGLNQAMKDVWQDQMLDNVLSMSGQHSCEGLGFYSL